MGQPAGKPPRNFARYWQMEAANTVFVPGLALALGFPRYWLEAIALILAIVATAGFLVVGTAYWRAVDRRLRLGDAAVTGRALALADRVEEPVLVANGLAIVATVAALISHGWSRSVIAAACLSLLAALEYINYYHRQLQHFDSAADLKRLLTGRGLRIAHMARELAKWRGDQGAR
ncbi:MAG: hypothetical protein ABIN68_01960 [Sphingomicrobium sp.]